MTDAEGSGCAAATAGALTSLSAPREKGEHEGGVAAAAVRRMRLRAVCLGSAVARGVTAAVLATRVGAALLVEAGECAALASAAQASAAGAVVMRLPLANAARAEEFAAAVAEYVAAHEPAVAQIAGMTPGQQVLRVGLGGTLLGALATAAVQESIAVAYFVSGAACARELLAETRRVAVAGTTTVAGGAAGAAAGTLVFPGAGTALGSLVGSYVGAFAPSLHAAHRNRRRIDDERRTEADRPLKVCTLAADDEAAVEEGEGDWLEVVDCSPESMYVFDARARLRAAGEALPSSEWCLVERPPPPPSASRWPAAGALPPPPPPHDPLLAGPDEVLLVWGDSDAEVEEEGVAASGAATASC